MDACDYQFEAPGQPASHLRILNNQGLSTSMAEWTKLENHRCPNCPLPVGPGACCPAAADVEPVVNALGSVASFASVKVTVTTLQRVYQQTVTGSEAARAAMGLVMATSACPVLADLRVLAHFHLPFATHEESTFRLVAAYLMRQFLTQQGPGQPRRPRQPNGRTAQAEHRVCESAANGLLEGRLAQRHRAVVHVVDGRRRRSRRRAGGSPEILCPGTGASLSPASPRAPLNRCP